MDRYAQLFGNRKPDLEKLRRQNPKLGDILRGEFSDKPNVYELPEGTVVSWTLVQGAQPQDPTYGRIPRGHFEFPTSHTEVVSVLSGTLEAQVEKQDDTHFNTTLTRNQSIMAPPQSLLKLDAKTPVYYFCQYK